MPYSQHCEQYNQSATHCVCWHTLCLLIEGLTSCSSIGSAVLSTVSGAAQDCLFSETMKKSDVHCSLWLESLPLVDFLLVQSLMPIFSRAYYWFVFFLVSSIDSLKDMKSPNVSFRGQFRIGHIELSVINVVADSFCYCLFLTATKIFCVSVFALCKCTWNVLNLLQTIQILFWLESLLLFSIEVS